MPPLSQPNQPSASNPARPPPTKSMKNRLLVTLFSICFGFGQAVFAQTVRPSTPTPVLTPVAPTPSTTPVAMVGNNQLPPQIAALSSEIDLFSYALQTAQWVDVSMWSQAQVGETSIPSIRLTGSATMSSIEQALKNMNASIKMSSVKEYIQYYVRVRDANGTLSVSGGDYKQPVVGKEGATLQPVVDLQLEYSTLILWRNLRGIKMTTFDNQGRITGTYGIEYFDNGFYFPTRAAGKVLLEVTVQDGDKTVTTVYDLRKATTADVTTVTVKATLSLRNYVEVTDKDQIILVPETFGGVGDNVLGAIILTSPRDMSVAARTIENKNATAFKYRQIDGSDTTWKTFPASPNGMATIKLGAGKWHVYGIFPDTALQPPPFSGGNGKG